MSPYQEKRIGELLNMMGRILADQPDRPPSEMIGGLPCMVWEARKLLQFPDIPGLRPPWLPESGLDVQLAAGRPLHEIENDLDHDENQT